LSQASHGGCRRPIKMAVGQHAVRAGESLLCQHKFACKNGIVRKAGKSIITDAAAGAPNERGRFSVVWLINYFNKKRTS